MIQKQMKCLALEWAPKLDRRLGPAQLAAVIALIYFYCRPPHTLQLHSQTPSLVGRALCSASASTSRAEVTKSSLTIAPAHVSELPLTLLLPLPLPLLLLS